MEKTDLVDEKQRARFQRVRNAICEQRILFATQGRSWRVGRSTRANAWGLLPRGLSARRQAEVALSGRLRMARRQGSRASRLASIAFPPISSDAASQASSSPGGGREQSVWPNCSARPSAQQPRAGIPRRLPRLAQHAAQREQDAYDRRAAEARRVIQGEPAATKEIASRKTTCQTQEWLAAA